MHGNSNVKFISRVFSCSFTCCWRACSDETWAVGSVPQSRNVLNTLENTTIRNSAHRKPSTELFNCSNGTTIAEAVNVQHIIIFGICEDVRHFQQHSYIVNINSHNGQLTLHTDSHAPYSGAVRRDGRTILGAKIETPLKWNGSTSETARNRIHVHIQFFILELPILWHPIIFTFPPGTQFIIDLRVNPIQDFSHSCLLRYNIVHTCSWHIRFWITCLTFRNRASYI